MSNVAQCDRCQTTATYGLGTGLWLHVTLGQFARPGDAGGATIPQIERELDFCSHHCLVGWARERVGEVPPK